MKPTNTSIEPTIKQFVAPKASVKTYEVDERFQKRTQLPTKVGARRRRQSSHSSRSSAKEDTNWRSTARKLEAHERLHPTTYKKGYEAYGRFLTTKAAATESSSDSNSRANIHPALHESTDRDPKPCINTFIWMSTPNKSYDRFHWPHYIPSISYCSHIHWEQRRQQFIGLIK